MHRAPNYKQPHSTVVKKLFLGSMTLTKQNIKFRNEKFNFRFTPKI